MGGCARGNPSVGNMWEWETCVTNKDTDHLPSGSTRGMPTALLSYLFSAPVRWSFFATIFFFAQCPFPCSVNIPTAAAVTRETTNELSLTGPLAVQFSILPGSKALYRDFDFPFLVERPFAPSSLFWGPRDPAPKELFGEQDVSADEDGRKPRDLIPSLISSHKLPRSWQTR